MVKTLPLASGTMTSDSSVSVVSAMSGSALEVTREDFFSTLRWHESDPDPDDHPQQENDGGSRRPGKSCLGSPLRGGGKSRAAGLSSLFRKSSHNHQHRGYQQRRHPQQRSWGRRQRSSSRHRRRMVHDDDCRSVVSNYEYGGSGMPASAAASDMPSSSSSVVFLSYHSSSPHRKEQQQRGDVSSSASSVVSCNVTIASHDTVKASNKSGWAVGLSSSGPGNGSSPLSSPTKMLKRWSKLRGLLGSTAATRDGSTAEKLYSLSEEGPRVRCSSEDGESRGKGGGSAAAAGGGGKMAARARSTPIFTRDEQTKLDQSILGRLDGLAVLSLGPAHRSTLDPEPDVGSSSPLLPPEGDAPPTRGFPASRPETLLPFERFPPFAFTGCSLYLAPRDMIRRMLWNSGEHPELVLEGLVPGEDRWSVRIEQISSTDRAACTENQPGSSIAATTSRRSIPCLRSIPIDPSLLSSEAFSPSISPVLREDQSGANSGLAPGDGGSPGLPAYQLWPKLWGTQDPAPDRAEVERMVEEDPLLHLAAEHSIPIDLDEQTFCISDRSHLDVIHNFVSASLSVGRLDTAIMILTKLLKGLDPVHDASMRYVRGAALHNLGVLYMWQAKYEYALDQFHLAVEERTATLPKDHPDVRVSLVWKGLAQFAQGRFEDALFCHELALEMTPSGDITRSKMLNNMGVVLYQMKHYMLALQKFTLSLEIQRGWLQGPVRRDSLVHEASLTLSNMGKLYLERGDYDLSYFVYEEALLLQTTIFRKDHDLVLESLMSLALTRARENLPEKALQILQGCLRSQTARYGKDSFQTMDALGYISYLHEYLKCPEDALKCLSVVKKWQKLNLPPGHPSLRKSRETLKRLEEAIGKNVSVWI